MKIIETGQGRLTLAEAIDGTNFVLTQVDDFDVEIESLRANSEFMAFLWQLSQEEATTSLQDLRQELWL